MIKICNNFADELANYCATMRKTLPMEVNANSESLDNVNVCICVSVQTIDELGHVHNKMLEEEKKKWEKSGCKLG